MRAPFAMNIARLFCAETALAETGRIEGRFPVSPCPAALAHPPRRICPRVSFPDS
ncbi:hypothetical protein [Roseovarius sp.]|uniref:hypothetical protein n=1 Tax=Roseovarius sp. TaxID=1486281 RepID=UPI0032EB16F4